MVKRTRKVSKFADESISSDDEDDTKHKLMRVAINQNPKWPPTSTENIRKESSSNSNDEDDNDDYLSLVLDDTSSTGIQLTKESEKASLETPIIHALPKGLRMMQLMGYKLGDSLGKATAQTSALSKPLQLTVKNNREGLRTHQTTTFDVQEQQTGTEPESFREWQHKLKDNERKLRMFQRMQKLAFEITRDIDRFQENSNPRDFNVLWRQYVIDLIATCRTKSKDTKENSFDHHHEEDSELEALQEMDIDQRIAKIYCFLRTELRYCFYCGCKYNDDEDLFAHCPGDQEGDHI